MSIKQRPRLEKFFNRIKTLLVAAPPRPVRPAALTPLPGALPHEQMELDLGLGDASRPTRGRQVREIM